MSTTILDRARDALSTLGELVGLIPRDLRPDFERAGFRLPPSAYAPPVKRTCCALTAKGEPCKNRAKPGFDMCLRHYAKSPTMVTELETRPHCMASTGKGKACKCNAFRGFQFCYSHAKKEGLIEGPPKDCAICYEAMTSTDRTKTTCGHYFHTACLQTWCETRGSMYQRGLQLRTKAPCPMCRKPFSLRRPPPVLPAWWTMFSTAPSRHISREEWVARLNVIPMSPMMTQEQLEMAAQTAGHMLLDYVWDHDGDFPSDVLMSSILQVHGITQR